MEGIIFIVVSTAVAIGFLVLGMSLTLIFKGRRMRSEIGSDPEMQNRGIGYTAQRMCRPEGIQEAGCAECACGACSKCDRPDSQAEA